MNAESTFRPPHSYLLNDNGVTDPLTLKFMQDAQEVYSSLYQGMPPIGDWIENRLASMIQGWLPGWCLSHAQIADPETPSLQSRSWDIVVHKPIPSDWGYPPPSTPDGGYVLVPKSLCRAVIDTKGRFDDVRGYAAKTAFDLDNMATKRQVDFLGDDILKVLFVVASTRAPVALMEEGKKYGLEVFAMAQVKDSPEEVTWKLNRGRDGKLPLQELGDKLVEASRAVSEP